MSRRYGRNQRRRARERIAQLEQESACREQDCANLNQAHAVRLARLVERNRALAGIIDMVREELPNYPLLPVDERAQDFSSMADELRDGRSAHLAIPMRAPTTYAVSAGVMDLEALYAEIVVLLAETDYCELSRQVHLQVQLGRSEVAYAISASAMCALPRHRLVGLLTGEIARALADALVDDWRGPDHGRRRR